MQEIWKDISGFEGIYEISSYGRVRSVKSGIILRTSKCGGCRGYVRVSLCKNGKVYGKLVHRLVAEAFIYNPDNLPEVNHRDEDKTNNRVDNLEFCDHKYNMNYGTRNIKSKDTHIKNGYWTGLSKEEYNRKYRECHKEELREYRECHKEDNRLYAKIYYENNKEKIREQHREYYEKNKEKINEYKEKNKEKIKEYKRAYYYRHREEILKKMKKSKIYLDVSFFFLIFVLKDGETHKVKKKF